MKKILLSCAAAAALLVITACSSSPKSQIIDLCNETAEQLKDAKGDQEKIEEITERFQEKCEKIEDGMSEKESDELSEDPEVREAIANVLGAAISSAF